MSVFKLKEQYDELPGQIDLQKIGQELEGIDNISPKRLVDLAKAGNKPELEKYFEWSDAIAGYRYRMTQAKKLLQNLTIVQFGQGESAAVAISEIRVFEESSSKDQVQTFVRIRAVPENATPRFQIERANAVSQLKTKLDQISNMARKLGVDDAEFESHLEALRQRLDTAVTSPV